MGPVGSAVGRVDVCHIDATDSTGCHLSRWAKRRIKRIMAFCLHADCLERAATNAVDIGSDGDHQRSNGYIDRLCPGAL